MTVVERLVLHIASLCGDRFRQQVLEPVIADLQQELSTHSRT